MADPKYNLLDTEIEVTIEQRNIMRSLESKRVWMYVTMLMAMLSWVLFLTMGIVGHWPIVLVLETGVIAVFTVILMVANVVTILIERSRLVTFGNRLILIRMEKEAKRQWAQFEVWKRRRSR